MEWVKKRLPIGIEDFEEFQAEDFYYVDKTLFIEELLQNWGKVNLFTRPRRFGKSLNMSMLKHFFEIGCDRTLFEGLKIGEKKELCEKYMGQFPVISISLKSVDGPDMETAAAAMRTVIGNEAMRFQFLEDSRFLSENERERYKALIRMEKGAFAVEGELLTDSLRSLSQLLFRHYGKKVMILIDEYDVPLDKAFQAGYYEEMAGLIRAMLSNALKTNGALYFAVLTGCLRISKESIFTGLNNLNVMTISDPYFCDSFGFTDSEVLKLLEYYGLEDFHGTVRDWYDGYRFGDISVYCPWDVIKYVQILLKDRKAEPENYWANTSGNDLIRRFLGRADQTARNEIEQLINGGTIVKPVRQELTYPDIDENADNIWSVLYSAGYLTQKERLPGGQMKLLLPNKEVKELLKELVKDWFQETAYADSSRINRFCAAFPAGDAAVIQDMLSAYLWDSISIRDTAVRRNMKENFYHGLLLGLLRSREDWLLCSNAETGEGYSDISICTPERLGIIIELKYADDGKLEAACAEALRQIEERKYAVGLQRRGMKRVIKYGIAFYEKECMAVMG